jgi:hypothetical protein
MPRAQFDHDQAGVAVRDALGSEGEDSPNNGNLGMKQLSFFIILVGTPLTALVALVVV